jgi:hypothetical protein
MKYAGEDNGPGPDETERTFIFPSARFHLGALVLLQETHNGLRKNEVNMKALLMASVLILGVSTIAKADKASDIPACTTIVKSCEAAGFEPGDHKKNGKGLWVDCVHAISKGKTVAGVSSTAAEAQGCIDAHKALKKK